MDQLSSVPTPKYMFINIIRLKDSALDSKRILPGAFRPLKASDLATYYNSECPTLCYVTILLYIYRLVYVLNTLK